MGMEHMIEIDELQLFPADMSLAEDVVAYYRRNREFLKEFESEHEEAFYTTDGQKMCLIGEEIAMKRGDIYRFYIRHKDMPGKIIGVIGLSQIIMGPFCSAFLGYKLDACCMNRGYMTALISLIVSHGFEKLHLHRIEANVMPWNKRSLRVLEKNGFEREGLAKKYLKINGVWEDHIHMVKINEALD